MHKINKDYVCLDIIMSKDTTMKFVSQGGDWVELVDINMSKHNDAMLVSG